MQTAAEWRPCFVRQAAEAVMLCGEAQVPREVILRRILHELADADWTGSPPEVSQLLHRIIREETASLDPYRALKDRMNQLALAALPACRELIAKGPGNYETLSQVAAPIFFLCTIKCPLVAAHIGSPTGTLVANRTAAWPT